MLQQYHPPLANNGFQPTPNVYKSHKRIGRSRSPPPQPRPVLHLHFLATTSSRNSTTTRTATMFSPNIKSLPTPRLSSFSFSLQLMEFLSHEVVPASSSIRWLGDSSIACYFHLHNTTYRKRPVTVNQKRKTTPNIHHYPFTSLMMFAVRWELVSVVVWVVFIFGWRVGEIGVGAGMGST